MRQVHAGAELRLGEGAREAGVDAHDLAGGFHLRPEDRVHTGEAGEGEDRFLDRDVGAMASSSSLKSAQFLARP